MVDRYAGTMYMRSIEVGGGQERSPSKYSGRYWGNAGRPRSQRHGYPYGFVSVKYKLVEGDNTRVTG
jgi:hypothetical protein